MEATAIVGIVVAGVVGPGLGYVAGWRSDLRHFRHERGLKAADDLTVRIDEVSTALEHLEYAAIEVRNVALTTATTEPDKLWKVYWAAQAAYQATGYSVARLEMRVHAGEPLLDAAKAAAKAFLDPAQKAHSALIASQAKDLPREYELLGDVPETIERAYAAVERFRVEGRLANAAVLGTERRSRVRFPSRPSVPNEAGQSHD